jgi:hypothetical protein
METMGSAGLSAAAKKRMETMGSAGLSAATQKGWKKRHADPDWDSPEADQRRSNATEHTLQLDNYVSGPANTESSSTQWEIDPTRLSQAATKGWEKRHADPDWDSPEAQQGRSDAVRQGKLKMGAQARSEAARKGKETMGPEARSEAARKAKVTRQFNKEFGDIIDLDGDQ